MPPVSRWSCSRSTTSESGAYREMNSVMRLEPFAYVVCECVCVCVAGGGGKEVGFRGKEWRMARVFDNGKVAWNCCATYQENWDFVRHGYLHINGRDAGEVILL